MRASSNPTPEEVAEAVGTLRTYALGLPQSRLAMELAIDMLDNADVFVGHDGEEV